MGSWNGYVKTTVDSKYIITIKRGNGLGEYMSDDYELPPLPLTMGDLMSMDAKTLGVMEKILWDNFMKVKQALSVVEVIEKELQDKSNSDEQQTKLLMEKQHIIHTEILFMIHHYQYQLLNRQLLKIQNLVQIHMIQKREINQL